MDSPLLVGAPSASYKTIGILGGLGPQATMRFEARIHQISQQLIPPNANTGYPPMVVYYVRRPPMRLSATGSADTPLIPAPELLQAATYLGQVADFIVITSNTPHFFIEELEHVSGRRVLSMIEVTLTEVQARHLRRVGVLGVGHSLRGQLYQTPLAALGVEAVTAPDALTDRLDSAIFAVMEGREDEHARQVAREAVASLRTQEVQAVILGCTELPLLLDGLLDEPDLIDPAALLAEAAVRYAIGDVPGASPAALVGAAVPHIATSGKSAAEAEAVSAGQPAAKRGLFGRWRR